MQKKRKIKMGKNKNLKNLKNFRKNEREEQIFEEQIFEEQILNRLLNRSNRNVCQIQQRLVARSSASRSKPVR